MLKYMKLMILPFSFGYVSGNKLGGLVWVFVGIPYFTVIGTNSFNE